MAAKYLEELYFAGTRIQQNIWNIGKELNEFNRFGTAINSNVYYMCGGSVKVNSVGAKKRIILIDRITYTPILGTYSNPDGTWQIKGIAYYPAKQLLAIAFDDNEEYNAEVADYITLKAM